MTNREYLNTLDDIHYAIMVIAKLAEIEQKKNFYLFTNILCNFS